MRKKIAIYNPYLNTKGGGEKVCLALASALSKNSKTYTVTLLTHSEVDINDLEKYFNIDLGKVQVEYINLNTLPIKILHKLPLPGKLRNYFVDVKGYRAIKRKKYDIFVNNCYQSNLPNPSKIGIYMCMFPQKLSRNTRGGLLKRAYHTTIELMYRLTLHPSFKHSIYSYQYITANSKFTQSYIEKYWKRESHIIYPICDNMAYTPQTEKRNILLHVGRFFENSGENHHKRQDVLLSSFSKMHELHKKGWELHFAGSVAEDVGALKYVLSLIKLSEGLPVKFHFNASFSELKQLYNDASIYLHATGYGSDQSNHPEKQEHFGIATVEAMSTGTLPVVINSAGQKESVKHGSNGYLWDTPSQLIDQTMHVATMSIVDISNMRQNAIKSAVKYDQAHFNTDVTKYFETLK